MNTSSSKRAGAGMMTPAKFAALAQLLRLREGQAKEAARLHLVEGVPIPDAARQVGMAYRDAHNAVARAKRGMELAKCVFSS